MAITDIYFDRKYAELCALAEEGEVCEFSCQESCGKITYLFLKRPIYVQGVFSGWYDIVSPYGYGGPVIRECQEGCKTKLISAYKERFEEYCRENQIVSEFIRFHPLVQNALDFKEVYEVIYSRKTVGSDLESYEDPVVAECTKSCRKHIRQALNKGITYRVTYQPENLHDFKRIYYATMERNHAAEYYYFDDAYFEKCLEYFRDSLLTVEALYDNQVIAMNLCFVSDGCIHIHLSGTLNEYLYLSPAYILRYALLQWGKEQGLKVIHHGGGRSSSPEDSLYLFKKQFGVHTEFDFYIGKKIRNTEIYKKLCRENNKPEDSEYFPAYRA